MAEPAPSTIRSKATKALVALAAPALALGYWLPAFVDVRATGFGDWQYFHHMWEVAYVAMVRYGEIALYDPYQCGGVPFWSDPQAQTFGPWFALALVFGTTLALKLGVVLHAAVGLAGAYKLARDDHRLSVPASALAAVVFCGSGFFAWHIAGGHSAFLPFYFAPLLAWCIRRAYDDMRYAVAVGALLALTLHEGGVYPMPYFMLLLFVEAVLDRGLRELPRAVLTLVVSGAFAAMLGAFRLVAIFIELRRHPRPTLVDDHLGLDELAMMLTAREHGWGVPGHPYVWPEYCAYVGIGVVVLGAVGYHLAVRQKRVRVAVGTLAFGLLAMGNLGEYAPWTLLHEVPFFDSLRVPSRFVVLFLLYLGLAAALSLEYFVVALPRRFALASVLPWLVVVGLAADITVSTRPIVNQWHGPHLAALDRQAAFQQRDAHAHAASFASLPRLGVGSVGCYVVLAYPVAPGIRLGPTAQAWLVGGVDGSARVSRRTVNRIELDVRTDVASTVVLNQNHAPDFVASVGEVVDEGGMLAVRVPAGRHRLVVRYAPESIRLAVLPFLAGVVVAGVLLRRRRRPVTPG